MSPRIFFIVFKDLPYEAQTGLLLFWRMKKSDLIREVAERQGIAPGTAADQMDRAVSRLVRTLRGGRPARLPGLGTISPGKRWIFHEETHER